MRWKFISHRIDESTASPEELVNNNLPLVMKYAIKYAKNEVQAWELFHVGYDSLKRASFKYDPSVGVKFFSYASRYVRLSMLNRIRMTHEEESRFVSYVSCSDGKEVSVYDFLSDITEQSPYDLMVRAETIKNIKTIVDGLDKHDKDVILDYWANDMTFEEMGRARNCTKQNIEQKLKRIYGEIRTRFESIT